MRSGVRVRPLDPASDLAWAETLLEAEFGGRLQARRGDLMDPLAGEAGGRVAEVDGARVGLITWVIGGSFSGSREAEIRALVVTAAARTRGIGGELLATATGALARAAAERAWLVTTNDNLGALGFYQRRGWRLAELRAGAVDEARRTLKPSIGLIGAGGIPIRDELILSIELARPV